MKPSERFNSLAQYYAERAGLPVDRVLRQISAESSFNPRAVSVSGAMGLLQLMPGTANDLGCDLPFDCDANLKAGTQYLAQIYSEIRIRTTGVDEADAYRMALVGYNAGPFYVYTALKNMKEKAAAITWDSFKAALPFAQVRGKTPRAKDAIAYAERILPLSSA
jgi:soluble lytic murein transglycosylase-like protein